MKICYLTGKKITEREKGEEISDENKSLEHIIPNALGGKIKSEYVINHGANQKLNKEIDIEFNKIFEPFHLRLNLKKDRASNKPSTRAFHKNHKKDVIYKDDRYYPLKPLYDPEKNHLYANSIKTGENYLNYLVREKIVENKDQVKIFDDMAGNINFSFGFDNNLFRKGMAKIAAGYATSMGIPRKNLHNIIDLQKNEFKDQLILAAFAPTMASEGFLEENIYKSDHFPIHSLVLNGNKSEGLLYCYVELFSSFQYYVLLDDNYDGSNVYESYIYDLTNSQEISYQDYATSIPDHEDLYEQLPNIYKKIDSEKFAQLNQIFNTNFEDIKYYNHQKFHILAAHTNHVSIREKLKKLSAERLTNYNQS